MHVGGPIRRVIQSGRSVRQVVGGQREPLLRVDVRDEDDLGIVHRRIRQIATLTGFDTAEQTEIGTAVSVTTTESSVTARASSKRRCTVRSAAIARLVSIAR